MLYRIEVLTSSVEACQEHGPKSQATAIKTETFREILRAKEAPQDDSF
jgi:hypothetical protein